MIKIKISLTFCNTTAQNSSWKQRSRYLPSNTLEEYGLRAPTHSIRKIWRKSQRARRWHFVENLAFTKSKGRKIFTRITATKSCTSLEAILSFKTSIKCHVLKTKRTKHFTVTYWQWNWINWFASASNPIAASPNASWS